MDDTLEHLRVRALVPADISHSDALVLLCALEEALCDLLGAQEPKALELTVEHPADRGFLGTGLVCRERGPVRDAAKVGVISSASHLWLDVEVIVFPGGKINKNK